jgi:hypothetical protein
MHAAAVIIEIIGGTLIGFCLLMIIVDWLFTDRTLLSIDLRDCPTSRDDSRNALAA